MILRQNSATQLGTRVRMLTMFNKLMIHFSFAVSLATFWKLINRPSLMSFFQFLGPILGYLLDASFHSGEMGFDEILGENGGKTPAKSGMMMFFFFLFFVI